MDRRNLRWVFVAGIVLAGGCGSSPPGMPGSGDDDGAGAPGGGTLDVAGTFVGLDGVRVIATTRALAAPVHLDVASVPAPSAEPWGDLAIAGSYYRISADRNVVAPADSPFVIGLPVPDGVDAAHLVIASVATTTAMLDGDRTPRDVWLPMTGRYDPTRRVMFSTLQRIPATGAIFALATSPDASSPAHPAARLRSAGSTDVQMTAFDFYVKCWGFPDHVCPAATDVEMALELADARRILVGLGYPEPRLEMEPAEIGTDNALIAIGYVVHLVPYNHDRCFTNEMSQGGIYYAEEGKLFVCLPQGKTSVAANVVDHEYFHSVQYAFPNVYDAGQTALLEGTANMVEGSIHEIGLHRSPDPVGMHLLDIEMLSNDYPTVYASQDLWVYIGRTAGAGLEYLIPVFSSAMTTSAISEALPGGNLRESYFSMATSNLMEKHELYDDFLKPSCVFESFIFLTDPLDTWEPDEPPPGGDLAPLTVHAFQRTFFDFPIVHASNASGDPNIRLAIYEEGSCERKPDNFRALDGKQYYFVFVNSSFDQAAHWQVSLKIN